MKDTCIFILLTSLLIIIPIGLYYDYTLNHQFLYVVEIPIETLKPNKCIFGLFTEQFKVTNSSYVYYPSYFSPISIRSVQNSESLFILDYLRQEQYVMLKDLVRIVLDNTGTLHNLSN